MALRATIYKAQLQVSDMDRGHYATHVLTIARHPSETEERLMVRLLAWALHADEALAFGQGLSTEDEPDLVVRDATGALDLWIEVGMPDEKWVRKACGRARRVVIVIYGSKAPIWWSQNREALARHANLTVLSIDAAQSAALARLASRNMSLSATLQDGHAWISSDAGSVPVEPEVLQGERNV